MGIPVLCKGRSVGRQTHAHCVNPAPLVSVKKIAADRDARPVRWELVSGPQFSLHLKIARVRVDVVQRSSRVEVPLESRGRAIAELLAEVDVVVSRQG